MFPLQRLFIPWVIGACLLCGCDRAKKQPATDSAGKPLAAVAVQLNWYPESEHGGLYQAAADETFTDAGLDVDLRPGGPAVKVGPELELGRCQFAMANADDVILDRQQGLDIVAVMAVMQNHPRCILVQEASGVETFEDLKGKTLQLGNRAFADFMRSKGLLDGVKEVPYSGSVVNLVADPHVAIQGYSFSEPLLAQQQGVKVRTLMVSDLGFNPYSSVLVTSGSLIKQNPELVRKFVQATRQGWQNYLADPTEGNAVILKANKHGMTPEVLKFGSTGLRSLAIPAGMTSDDVGQMTAQRWQTLVSQMVDLKLIDADKVKAADCFTTEFLQ